MGRRGFVILLEGFGRQHKKVKPRTGTDGIDADAVQAFFMPATGEMMADLAELWPPSPIAAQTRDGSHRTMLPSPAGASRNDFLAGNQGARSVGRDGPRCRDPCQRSVPARYARDVDEHVDAACGIGRGLQHGAKPVLIQNVTSSAVTQHLSAALPPAPVLHRS